MRTLAPVSLIALALLMPGCGKKSSKEYFEAQRSYETLVNQGGEDAYLTAEMAQVSAVLAAVPKRAVEYELAQALVAKIAAERTRLEAERAAVARVDEAAAGDRGLGVNMPPSLLPTQVAGVALEESDGGPGDDAPTAGMLEALFKEKYAGCVSGPEPLAIPGEGDVPAYRVNDGAACMKKLGVTAPSRFFFIKGSLAGRASSTTTRTTVILDGGARAAGPGTAPEPQVRAGPPLPTTPPQAPRPGDLTPAGTGAGMQYHETGSGLAPRPNP